MKKFTAVLIAFVLSLALSNVTLANGVDQEVKQITKTIEKVYYMKGSGYYVAHTSKDDKGHFWVLQVTDIALPKEDRSFTQSIIKQYQGKQVVVTFIEPSDIDKEVEILGVKLK